jgi:hypothetical protein
LDEYVASILRVKESVKQKNRHEAGNELSSVSYLLPAGFLFGLFFDPEDGGNMFLQNVD